MTDLYLGIERALSRLDGLEDGIKWVHGGKSCPEDLADSVRGHHCAACADRQNRILDVWADVYLLSPIIAWTSLGVSRFRRLWHVRKLAIEKAQGERQ